MQAANIKTTPCYCTCICSYPKISVFLQNLGPEHDGDVGSINLTPVYSMTLLVADGR